MTNDSIPTLETAFADPMKLACDALAQIADMEACPEAARLAADRLAALRDAVARQAPCLYARQSDLDRPGVRHAVTTSKYRDGEWSVPLYATPQTASTSEQRPPSDDATIKDSLQVAAQVEQTPAEKLASFPLEAGGYSDADDSTVIAGFGTWQFMAGDVRRARRLTGKKHIVLPAGWAPLPEEPSDEMLRVILAVEMPATFREYLRHPAEGPKSRAKTEEVIAKARRQYHAIHAAAKADASLVVDELAQKNADEATPFAWHNGVTDQFTRDPDTGYIWELNKHMVTRLARMAPSDTGSA